MKHRGMPLAIAAGTMMAVLACSGGDSSPETAGDQPIATGGAVVVGTAPPATRGVPSVVMLDPLFPGDHPVPGSTPAMDQFGLSFLPNLVLARVGQAVEFSNSENVDHTVLIVEAATEELVLDASTPPDGRVRHVFTKAGEYNISCDIHGSMTALVLVVSAPYAVAADDEGAFSIQEVPPGSYTLTLWTADPSLRMERVVEIHAPQTELILDRP